MPNVLPKDGFAGLRAHWKVDALSGFLVFLIALPLSLGIAMASGFPPFAGLITAMVGGLVVSPFMGSRLSIKGPAAGLISIAAMATLELGNGDVAQGYPLVLAVIAFVGLIQIGLGALKWGKWVDLFPTSAVHGMLAAIGIIIMSKQLPVLLGVTPAGKKPLELLSELPTWLLHMDSQIAAIGLTSLGILVLWHFLPAGKLKKVPAPLLVLVLSVGMANLLSVDATRKVRLPDTFLGGFVFPDFSRAFDGTTWLYVVMFALVGSLESLLTVKAVDGLDPFHRRSNANKDLIAVGVGNSLAGILGGLPMIAEVVRSSANVNNGAKTRWSNFFHGLFLLAFVALLPRLLELVPLSALAALLVFTGFRLASPALFALTARIGWDQLLVFVVTIVFTLVEDLLVGIFMGTALELLLQLGQGVPLGQLFKIRVQKDFFDQKVNVTVSGNLGFESLVKLERLLQDIPFDREVVLDIQKSYLIDHSAMEFMERIEHEFKRSGGVLKVVGLEHFKNVSKHPLSTRKNIQLRKK